MIQKSNYYKNYILIVRDTIDNEPTKKSLIDQTKEILLQKGHVNLGKDLSIEL